MARIHRKTIQQSLKDPDNHNSVVTHLESDILVSKSSGLYKAFLWTKLVEVMKFQLSYFKSLKMMPVKCYIQYVSKFGKLSSGHRTGKFSFHSNPKEGQCQRIFKLPYNCAVVWTVFGIAFFGDWNKTWPFLVLWTLLSFPNLLPYWVQHFYSINFQDFTTGYYKI